jgi:S-adenosylmethionine synthetase
MVFELSAGVDSGGAFSGKRPSKVARSGSYLTRFVARQGVLTGLASHCELQVTCAIDCDPRVSARVVTFGTGDARASDAFAHNPSTSGRKPSLSGLGCVDRSFVAL